MAPLQTLVTFSLLSGRYNLVSMTLTLIYSSCGNRATAKPHITTRHDANMPDSRRRGAAAAKI